MINHQSKINFKKQSTFCERGFSLVEMMVSVSLFAVVMLVATGALLSLMDASRKAQALQSVMNNLNIALDGMVRGARMGSTFHCGNIGVLTQPRDCLGGDIFLAFEPFGGDPSDVKDQVLYWFDQNDRRLYKSVDGGVTGFAITAPEVQIDDLTFYVTGSTPSDSEQPKAVITVKGTAGIDRVKTRTSFSIQATASQRLLDI